MIIQLNSYSSVGCSVHPFFLHAGPGRPGSILEKTKPKTKSLARARTKMDIAASISTAASMSAYLGSVPQHNKYQTDAHSLPVYSYKDYFPKPTTVYTQHEEEADELVQALRG